MHAGGHRFDSDILHKVKKGKESSVKTDKAQTEKLHKREYILRMGKKKKQIITQKGVERMVRVHNYYIFTN